MGTTKLLVERHRLNDGEEVMALITLNQAEHLNPLDWDTIQAVIELAHELEADETVRTIAITGAGRAFSAGGDLSKYIELQRDPYEYPRYNAEFHRMVRTIAHLPKPCIALVNGVAVAGGLELMLACDFAFGSEAARVGDAHLNFGQMGGGGSLNLLPHAVGIARARELVLSGRIVDAREAESLGLLLEVLPADALVARAVEWSRSLAEKSAAAVRNAKDVMNTAYWEGVGLTPGLRLESEMALRYGLTYEDPQEGLKAFSEKRKPAFTGR